jgi:hypothetical protein
MSDIKVKLELRVVNMEIAENFLLEIQRYIINGTN